mmetsp:Transcript_32984/g.50468  ORF Transcript_32984/g.50468 Transcript_32984/m.50468 type:complete len:159 (-) Transcript_32984:43-519(-)|eukprot:CAMPEP_0170480816 /NCGR_PEP_ID=MMETSP0208-20121228/1506_1 /TAXON_ID=197538 /ORGANISM="Strombidium inclinatum, Strain S3" /LENGTH=158 /DNA_ID=CAMNT_0010753415 /DNA_START=8 /DNA_END=484 /DNA_ORIENTATION=+
MSHLHHPEIIPDVLLHNQDVTGGLYAKALTAQTIRSDDKIMSHLKEGNIPTDFVKGIHGLPFHASAAEPSLAATNISLENDFHPDLAKDSNFYGALDKFVKCVEKHPAASSAEEQNALCGAHFKRVRQSALKNDLLYHNVHKRLFMDLISYKKGEQPL